MSWKEQVFLMFCTFRVYQLYWHNILAILMTQYPTPWNYTRLISERPGLWTGNPPLLAHLSSLQRLRSPPPHHPRKHQQEYGSSMLWLRPTHCHHWHLDLVHHRYVAEGQWLFSWLKKHSYPVRPFWEFRTRVKKMFPPSRGFTVRLMAASRILCEFWHLPEAQYPPQKLSTI